MKIFQFKFKKIKFWWRRRRRRRRYYKVKDCAFALSNQRKFFSGEKNVLNVESKTRKATHDGKRSRRQVHNLRNECWEIDTKDNKALRGKHRKTQAQLEKYWGMTSLRLPMMPLKPFIGGNKRK